MAHHLLLEVPDHLHQLLHIVATTRAFLVLLQKLAGMRGAPAAAAAVESLHLEGGRRAPRSVRPEEKIGCATEFRLPPLQLLHPLRLLPVTFSDTPYGCCVVSAAATSPDLLHVPGRFALQVILLLPSFFLLALLRLELEPAGQFPFALRSFVSD
jgi:hypothetical protein